MGVRRGGRPVSGCKDAWITAAAAAWDGGLGVGRTLAIGITRTRFFDANGKLGTLTSSVRFKEDIKPMDKASETLFALNPVTFRYKKDIDAKGTPQFGLVAEEVAKVNPSLVINDRDGKPYTVRYEVVNAMLLNEFLKAHRKLEEQQKTIAELKSTIAQPLETVTARLNEHDAQIQKVSARVELSKPAPRTVVDNQ